ncbi:MAG: hypothetical protein ACRDWH_06315 [Acidimicrobiia bacterium]
MLIRQRLRYVAAAMAAVASAIYFLIGFEVVTVIENRDDQAGFGLPAGVGFAVAALLILLFDNRLVWAVGAVMQTVIIFLYFSFASQRIPQFEFWGLTIRLAQFVLLAALVYLAVGRRDLARPMLKVPAGVGKAAT